MRYIDMTDLELRVKQWQDDIELRRAELAFKKTMLEAELQFKRDELEFRKASFDAEMQFKRDELELSLPACWDNQHVDLG